jgi:hypothetical protein
LPLSRWPPATTATKWLLPLNYETEKASRTSSLKVESSSVVRKPFQ